MFTDQPLTSGINVLDLAVPAGAAPGAQTFARFRVNSAGGLAVTGEAADGEVEDHAVAFAELDFGDAPDPTYPTLLASDGPRHLLGGGLFLGSSVDGESDGQPSAGADGDDLAGTDDEDGVVVPASVLAGAEAQVEVIASAAGLLDAWVDLNGDGDWLDAGEQAFASEPLAAGSNALSVVVPLDAAPGTAFARFRVSSAGGLAPTGMAVDGEVEDHAFVVEPSAELEVVINDLPDPVPEGAQLTYLTTVRNNGQLDATGSTLSQSLPPEVVFSSVLPGPPTCVESSGVVTCDLGPVSAAASTHVEIVVDVPYMVLGTITTTAAVTLDQTDPVPANNTASEDTTVVDDAIYIFGDGFEVGSTTAWDQTVP